MITLFDHRLPQRITQSLLRSHGRQRLSLTALTAALVTGGVCLCANILHSYTAGAQALEPPGAAPHLVAGITLEGAGLALGPGASGGDLVFDASILLTKYPSSRAQNPAFHIELPDPVTTDKIRLISRDAVADVTEIRLFEAGMPQYPPVMDPESSPIAVPNYALTATASATSSYGGGERRPSNVIDDKMGFESRWVSAGRGPHTLTLELGQSRSIGVIQMISGYERDGQWQRVATDFEFEYWDGKGWRPLPGATMLDEEPGRLGLVVGYQPGRGGVLLLNDNAVPQWSIHRLDAQGKPGDTITTVPAKPLRAGQIYRLRAIALGNSLALYVNGERIITTQALEMPGGTVGLWSGAASNNLQVVWTGLTLLDPHQSTWLSDLTVMHEGATIPLAFDSSINGYELQLPSAAIKAIELTARAAVNGQRICIDGKSGASAKLDLISGQTRDVNVQVTAADGKTTASYHVRLRPIPPAEDMTLVFADEFEGDSLDRSAWTYRTGQRWQSI